MNKDDYPIIKSDKWAIAFTIYFLFYFIIAIVFFFFVKDKEVNDTIRLWLMAFLAYAFIGKAIVDSIE